MTAKPTPAPTPEPSAGSPIRGVVVYCVVALVLATALPVAMSLAGMELTSGATGVVFLVGMWIPALARFVATRTVDRGFVAPLPAKRWGRPRSLVFLVPLLAIVAIYGLAYGVGMAIGVRQDEPAWQGLRKIAANVSLNLPLLLAWGLVGGIGEELGWRGYLQPRLDQAGVRGSLLVVVVVEWVFHLPFIVLLGYTASTSIWGAIALFFFGKLAATPLWTLGTYRLRSVWVAFWFHTIHNALSQTIFPKILGAGDDHVLGEFGIYPVACYLAVTLIAFAWTWRRGLGWSALARQALEPTQ